MRHLHITACLAILAALATGCDNIDESDRYIKEEKPVSDNPRTLLIMEFTGNACKNCPNGAKTVELISEDEPGRVITVGLHPFNDINTNPVPNPNTTPTSMQDFRTEVATSMKAYYNPSGFPSAVFNGVKSSLSGSINDWQTRALEALSEPAAMTVAATCQFSPETSGIEISYDVDFSNNVSGTLNINVWIMENDILGTQLMPDGKYNFQYIHNHVLRGSLTGDWGNPLGGDRFDSDSRMQGKIQGTLDAEWDAGHCQAVVFVTRESDHEVLQACVVDLVES